MVERSDIIDALKTVFDPEIPASIWDLGLVYDLHIDDTQHVSIHMTLTTPNCPVADTIPVMVEKAVMQVGGVAGVDVSLVWDPPWTQDMMSEEAKLELGLW